MHQDTTSAPHLSSIFILQEQKTENSSFFILNFHAGGVRAAHEVWYDRAIPICTPDDGRRIVGDAPVWSIVYRLLSMEKPTCEQFDGESSAAEM
jgi:hypothetical protein